MATIEQIRDPARRLTTHRVSGELSLEESLVHTEQYNAAGADFRTFWDFSDGWLPDAAGANIGDLSIGHAEAVLKVLERPDRLVALATPRPRDYGVLRVWAVFAMEASPGIEWQVFRDNASALAWLMSRPAPQSA